MALLNDLLQYLSLIMTFLFFSLLEILRFELRGLIITPNIIQIFFPLKNAFFFKLELAKQSVYLAQLSKRSVLCCRNLVPGRETDHLPEKKSFTVKTN